MSTAFAPAPSQHDPEQADRVMRGTWRQHVIATVEHSGQTLPFVAAYLVDIIATSPTTLTRHPGSAAFRDLVNEQLLEHTGQRLTRGDMRRGLEELERRNLLPTWHVRGTEHGSQRPELHLDRACDRF
ncbi:hypothetical protein [Leucobacter sp. W1038]|uniref:hypothetical protein n=1 Tax=Leucobacter sp. W1038 TaxID=3438281 RepID=UPI003D98F2AC